MARTEAEHEGVYEGLRAAAEADKERMIEAHAAELERCAGSAGTEVLRLTDAMDRARKETARLQSALSEAARGFDADKVGRCKAENLVSID